MKKGIRPIPAVVLFALTLGFFSSCTPEEEFSGIARVEAAFRLKSNSAMEGKVAISEAFLKLDRIQATGSLRGEQITDITHPVSPEEPPYRLSMADSSHVNFALTSKTYEQLDLHLFLFQDTYELVINTREDAPPPVDGSEDEGEQGEDNSGGDDGDGSGGDQNENDNEGGDGNNDSDGDENEDEDDANEDNGSDGDDDDNDDGNDDEDEDRDDEDGDDEDEDGDDDDSNGDKNEKDKNQDKDKGKNKDKDRGDDDDDDDDDEDDDEDDDDNDDDDNDDDDNDDDDNDDDDGRTAESLRTVDLDHFFQNAKPAMVVFGLYQNNGMMVNIIFAASGIEKFTVRAKQNDSFTIALDEQNSAEISFDPQRWFEGLTPADIESASIQTYQQQKVLFIHKDFNTPLFQALVSRIEESADLVIRKGEGANF